MKQKRGNVRKYSIDDMNDLVSSILKGTNDTEEDLASRLGYNKGYITQCRSRGEVADKFILNLQKELKEKTANSKPELTVNDIVMLRAAVSGISGQVARLTAKIQGRPFEDCLDELEQNIQIILKGMLRG